MSVFVNDNGTLSPIAGNGIQNTFTGTTAQVQAAMQSGAITEGMIVYITDDGSNELAENIGYDNTTSGLAADNVQEAVDELKSDLTVHVLPFSNVTLNQFGAATLTGLDSSKDIVEKVVIKGSSIYGTYHLIYTDQSNAVFVQIINYKTNQPYVNEANVSFDVYYRTIN